MRSLARIVGDLKMNRTISPLFSVCNDNKRFILEIPTFSVGKSRFLRNQPPLDLRPVCKFKFVRCGPVEKKQCALSLSV